MKRDSTIPSVDHRIFNLTARKTKKINVEPRIQRGGILL